MTYANDNDDPLGLARVLIISMPLGLLFWVILLWLVL